MKFVQHSQSLLPQNEYPVDNYLFQILRNENEVNAANSQLYYAEEGVDPQSEKQKVINDGIRLEIQVETTKHNATIVR